MSGGDVLIIGLSFVLIIWSFFATRRARQRAAGPARLIADETDEREDFLRAGVEWCQQLSGAKRVVLWAVDEAAGLVRPLVAVGGARPNAHVLHGSPITWIARERISSRIAPPPEWAETLRVFGVAVLQAQPKHALTLELVDDIDVNPEQFEGLGIYLGALLNVQQDHELLAALQERFELQNEALRRLPNAPDVASLAQELVQFAVRVTRGHGAAFVSWNGTSGELVAVEGATLGRSAVIDTGESLAVLCARGAATLSKDRNALRKLHVLSPGESFERTPEIAVAIPLIDQDTVVGVLTVWSAHQQIDVSAITSLESIAPYAAARLQQAQQLGQMQRLADIDGLTGLANRRAFESHLLAEWARWERYQRPFSLLLFDIDHFKRVNDQYGHDAGDEVLRAVSTALRGLLRGSDFAARHGGEEFAVILPEARGRTAVEIAERVRAHISELPIIARGQHIPVTISGGVVSTADNMTAEDMVRRADQLLYRAKQSGRNRIEFGPVR